MWGNYRDYLNFGVKIMSKSEFEKAMKKIQEFYKRLQEKAIN